MHAAAMEKLQKEHDAEVQKHVENETRLQGEIDALKAQIEQLEANVQRLQGTVQAKDNEILAMRDSVAQANAAMEKCIQEHAARTKEIELQFKEKEIKLQNNLRKTMEQLIAEQTQEIGELQSEF